MNRTTRVPRYALTRYHYCTSNQSFTTRYVTNYWGQRNLLRDFGGRIAVKRKRHVCAAGSPDSLARGSVKDPTPRSRQFRIDPSVFVEYCTSECSSRWVRTNLGAIRRQCGAFAWCVIYPDLGSDDCRASDKFERPRKVAPVLLKFQ